MKEVPFLLPAEGADWPPVSVEWMHLSRTSLGYRVENAPLFIKDMSVQDVIAIKTDKASQVLSWRHIKKSRRSVMWLMGHQIPEAEAVLSKIRSLGCNTESWESHGYYAVDIPEEVSLTAIDRELESAQEGAVSFVFPSLRHDENS